MTCPPPFARVGMRFRRKDRVWAEAGAWRQRLSAAPKLVGGPARRKTSAEGESEALAGVVPPALHVCELMLDSRT